MEDRAWATVAAPILLLPFAMEVTDRVVWEVAGFAFFGALLVDAGITYERPHAALAEHFSQKQVAEIAASVINMGLRTRLKLAQGAIPVAE
jgi:hypothetical protein